MEIHSPEAPVHSWRDFAIHLVIITIGLFIALSLEGLVEHIHQRHLVRDARANIHQEVENNHKSAQQDLVYIQQDIDRVKANMANLHQLVADPKNFHGSLSFTMEFTSLDDAAWTTARDTSALGFMPYNEVQGYSELYQQQMVVSDQAIEVFHRQTLAMAPVFMEEDFSKPKDNDFSKLPPSEFDALLHDTSATLIDLTTLEQLMQQLDQQYIDELKK